MARKKIIRNIFWLLAEHGTRMALGLVVTAVLARQLGVEQYGVFQYAISLVAIFSSISFICGAEVLVPMLTNANVRERQEIMGNAFAVRLFFSGIAFIGLVSFSFFTEERQVFYLIALLGITLLFNESFAVVTAWLQSQTNSKPRSILVMVSLVVKAGIMGGLYYYRVSSPLYYALAYIIDPLTVALGLFFIFYKKTGQTFFNYSFSIAYDLFKKGLPFFWGVMAMFLFSRLDIIMLKNLSTLKELGYYSAGFELVKSLNNIAPIMAMSIAPIMVYKINDEAIVKRNVIKIALLLLCVAVLGAGVIHLLADKIIPILLGDKYIQSIPVLMALSWVSCFFFLNEALNIYLLKIQKGRLVVIKWLLAITLALFAYSLLIPKMGGSGAVIGYGVGYLTACLASLFFMFGLKDGFKNDAKKT